MKRIVGDFVALLLLFVHHRTAEDPSWKSVQSKQPCEELRMEMLKTGGQDCWSFIP